MKKLASLSPTRIRQKHGEAGSINAVGWFLGFRPIVIVSQTTWSQACRQGKHMDGLIWKRKTSGGFGVGSLGVLRGTLKELIQMQTQ